MGRNRYFREPDGLSLDLGPFVVALEYAGGVEAEITGKPDRAFFGTALDDIGVAPEELVMIGDDLPNDIGGAQALGLRGVLVRTGKYQPDDERDPEFIPEHVADRFSDAVDWILSR
jgi:HAD superfamily hydrolase (TIGR01458 family)